MWSVRRPALAVRPGPGGARPRGQGEARGQGLRARPPLPARRGHPVRRRHGRLVQGWRGTPPPPQAEYIAVCGRCAHFMAESADILPSTTRRWSCPTSRPVCSMADMATAEQVAECWDVLTEAGVAEQVVPVVVHELLGRHQGLHRQARRHDLHLVQRRARPGLGLRAGREGPLPAGPAPGPQHRRPRHGDVPGRLRGLQPAQAERRADRRGAARRQDDPVAGPLLGARSLLAGLGERRPRAHPGCERPRPPRVPPRGRRRRGLRRLDRVHHQHPGGGPGRFQVGDRHGAEPGPAPGEPFRRPRTRRSCSSTRRSASARP
ncbi:Quinolinate synthase A [Streptomyces tanashiensis]